jgi:tRNA (cmo5U34)-methyltransferase
MPPRSAPRPVVGLVPCRPVGEQWHFDPDTYFAMVRSEIPGYDRLQQVLADSTVGVAATTILDLGSGTGVTAQRVLSVHPGASLIGLDASEAMLAHARELVPDATFLVSELEAPLPAGPFELVVSAFAVHHLDGAAKADLFARVAAVLAPGGRFALCDVVVPAVPVAEVARPVPLEAGVDLPSTVDEQVAWLAAAGLEPRVVVVQDDLAIITADRPTGEGS